MEMEKNSIKKVLLIVDDEPDLLEVLSELLMPLCDNVLTASNGVEALQQLEKNTEICAVLSDVNMPKMNGLVFLENIRLNFNPIPFVILTAHGDAQMYREAVKLNATDFLEKPFEPKIVSNVMERAIEYGCQIIEAERKLEEIYRDSKLPLDKINEIKRVKRTIHSMRIENNLYQAKKKNN